jgi:hypothetical protein
MPFQVFPLWTHKNPSRSYFEFVMSFPRCGGIAKTGSYVASNTFRTPNLE